MANQILVDELAVTMELKNNGIRLRVAKNGRLRGYIQIGRGGLRWFRGKKKTPSGTVSLDKFIKWSEK